MSSYLSYVYFLCDIQFESSVSFLSYLDAYLLF